MFPKLNMATKRHHSRTSRCLCGCWWGALPNFIGPTKIFVNSRNNFFYTVILTCPLMWLCERYVQSFFFAHLFYHHVNCCRDPHIYKKKNFKEGKGKIVSFVAASFTWANDMKSNDISFAIHMTSLEELHKLHDANAFFSPNLLCFFAGSLPFFCAFFAGSLPFYSPSLLRALHCTSYVLAFFLFFVGW